MDVSDLNAVDVKSLSEAQCAELALVLRKKIIQTVARNGGHLSSNLGIVDMTIALHRAFSLPDDKLVFDVGHQCYAHKLLTGRADRFDTLRAYGGLSGFPRCDESEYDAFETGHASTAISAALGLARARDELGQKHHVVAIVGDGALTGGMCYEALNDCGTSKTQLIVILNDNEMSIARNVGALSEYLSKLRVSAGWNTTKRKVKFGLLKIPVVGKPLHDFIHTLTRVIKGLVANESFFSSLGFRYFGPIDGHNIKTMEKMFRRAMKLDMPVIIHCVTHKGSGYGNAEQNPEGFHGTPPFFIESGEMRKQTHELYGEIAVNELNVLAKQDRRIEVVTAAMPLGTSAFLFKEQHHERFWDVGIAEEHGVTMCAGLAKGGMRPFFFVYSTFLQRGFDQVLHDVCMQRLPVVLMLDRSGLSNEDGQSHQGLFDIAYLRAIPNMTIFAPADADELRQMIRAAVRLGAPCAIRYPKNAVALPGASAVPFETGRWRALREGTDATVLAVGSMVPAALHVAERLANDGHSLTVVNASTVKPLDRQALARAASAGKPILTIEEHMRHGGFGSSVAEALAQEESRAPLTILGVADEFVPQGDHQSLLKHVRLDDDSLAEDILKALCGRGNPHA